MKRTGCNELKWAELARNLSVWMGYFLQTPLSSKSEIRYSGFISQELDAAIEKRSTEIEDMKAKLAKLKEIIVAQTLGEALKVHLDCSPNTIF